MNNIFDVLSSGNGLYGTDLYGDIVTRLSSWYQYVIYLAIYVIETIILYKLSVPLFGLRFVPIYGDYYFLKGVAPDKKKLSLIYVICKCFVSILSVVFLLSFVVAIISLFGSDGSNPFLVWAFLSGILLLVFVIVCIVLSIKLNMSIAERFGFDRWLGLLFLITLVRDICCLVKCDAYIYDEDFEDEDESGTDDDDYDEELADEEDEEEADEDEEDRID